MPGDGPANAPPTGNLGFTCERRLVDVVVHQCQCVVVVVGRLVVPQQLQVSDDDNSDEWERYSDFVNTDSSSSDNDSDWSS